MSNHFKNFLIVLGVFFGGLVLLIVIAMIDRAREDEAHRARMQEMDLQIQALKNQRMQIEAQRAGEKAVRDYDWRHASPEERRRMTEADLREIERLNAIIRVEKEQQP